MSINSILNPQDDGIYGYQWGGEYEDPLRNEDYQMSGAFPAPGDQTYATSHWSSLFVGDNSFTEDVGDFPAAQSLSQSFDPPDDMSWQAPGASNGDFTQQHQHSHQYQSQLDSLDLSSIATDSTVRYDHTRSAEAEETPSGIDSMTLPGTPQSNQGGKVCYGMIPQIDVKLATKDMKELNARLLSSQARHDQNVDSEKASNDQDESRDIRNALNAQEFVLIRNADHFAFTFDDGRSFGYLRERMSNSLSSIMNRHPNPILELEGVGITSKLCERIERTHEASNRILQLDVNVYGPRESAARIGAELTEQKIWLQKPSCWNYECPYENPHLIHFPELEDIFRQRQQQISAAAGRGPPRPERNTHAVVDRGVQQLMTSVQQGHQRDQELTGTDGDARLKTNLLQHQERALTFLVQRESGEIPEKHRLWAKTRKHGQEVFTHKVTGAVSSSRKEERGGGILADEMGMGKSLSILALILSQLETGRKWAEEKTTQRILSSELKQFSHATLIVVPSLVLIKNWLHEITSHLVDSLQYESYHGQRRERRPDVLASRDVVITTYHTLAKEFTNKRKTLFDIHWYRVVLDEAHMIRHQRTELYRTCAALEARSRWCLTGTPVQNRLDDIGALFAFVRAEPFHNIGMFRQFIVNPYTELREFDLVRTRLGLLYDAFCLRRKRDILELPGVDEETRLLRFSAEEKRKYDKTYRVLERSVDGWVGHAGAQDKFGAFQVELQLRILCNHGTYQKMFSWKQRSMMESREARIMEQGLSAETRCNACKQLRSTMGVGRVFDTCEHFLCTECIDDAAESAGGSGGGGDNNSECPLCRIEVVKHQQHAGSTATAAARGHGTAQSHGGRAASVRGAASVNTREDGAQQLGGNYFNDTGFSTKMNALVEDVKKDLTQNSIIFSCWTRTLDLIGRHLSAEGVSFLRINGDIPTSRRMEILDEFERTGSDKTPYGHPPPPLPQGQKPPARVLLMTTGTGAHGLNIVTARRVFIVELQWNPSVENQAIARTTRIGQEERIKVTRYVMEGTIEQEMQSQQMGKRDLARMGWLKNNNDGSHG